MGTDALSRVVTAPLADPQHHKRETRNQSARYTVLQFGRYTWILTGNTSVPSLITSDLTRNCPNSYARVIWRHFSGDIMIVTAFGYIKKGITAEGVFSDPAPVLIMTCFCSYAASPMVGELRLAWGYLAV